MGTGVQTSGGHRLTTSRSLTLPKSEKNRPQKETFAWIIFLAPHESKPCGQSKEAESECTSIFCGDPNYKLCIAFNKFFSVKKIDGLETWNATGSGSVNACGKRGKLPWCKVHKNLKTFDQNNQSLHSDYIRAS